jgi:hypothetical protein
MTKRIKHFDKCRCPICEQAWLASVAEDIRREHDPVLHAADVREALGIRDDDERTEFPL